MKWNPLTVDMSGVSLPILVIILAAAGTLHVLLRWLVRRKLSRDHTAIAAAPTAHQLLGWFDIVLRQTVQPLLLMIWTLAVAAAAVTTMRGGGDVAQFGDNRAVVTLAGLSISGALFWLLIRVGTVIESATESFSRGAAGSRHDVLLPIAGTAVRLLLPLVALFLVVQALPLPLTVQQILHKVLTLVVIGTGAFLLYRCVEAAQAFVIERHRVDVTDNLAARTVHTQVVVLKKIATTVIVLFAVASMLMVFESVRQFGTSILASAGIAGIIIGFAAQRSISTLLAGFQIAATQPIRLDDVVIVEGEWGRIEDITLTYVSVRIWDDRRLIVPIAYFIEQPFQNWTRTSAELLGTVFLHVDYCVPLEALRQELTRILQHSPHWNGKVNVLQVTEAREHTLELRALASAADASLAWDLRCEIREKLVQFLQREYPESLPRLRAELRPALSASRL